MFDTQSAAAQRTAPVENVILRGEMLFESASYRFTPRFDVLDVTIQPADRAQLDKIANDWRGVSHLRLTAVGHSDQLLIAARNRAVYADNYALSRARAEVVAKYLAERLSIDPSRVTIEGRGADEPLATGHDRASLALNRRVDIAIEGLRIVAAGGLMVKTAARRRAGRDGRHAGLCSCRARRPPRRRLRAAAQARESTSNSCSRRPRGSRRPRTRFLSIPSMRIVDPASADADGRAADQRRGGRPAQLRRRRDQRSRRR